MYFLIRSLSTNGRAGLFIMNFIYIDLPLFVKLVMNFTPKCSHKSARNTDAWFGTPFFSKWHLPRWHTVVLHHPWWSCIVILLLFWQITLNWIIEQLHSFSTPSFTNVIWYGLLSQQPCTPLVSSTHDLYREDDGVALSLQALLTLCPSLISWNLYYFSGQGNIPYSTPAPSNFYLKY